MSWTFLNQDISGMKPALRVYHGFVILNHRAYIFGGYNTYGGISVTFPVEAMILQIYERHYISLNSADHPYYLSRRLFDGSYGSRLARYCAMAI
jgi:hypothetical protein